MKDRKISIKDGLIILGGLGSSQGKQMADSGYLPPAMREDIYNAIDWLKENTQ